jgi:EAL domain-containing protein (putative c-di-GMP-specific phosphodiesterase class I)
MGTEDLSKIRDAMVNRELQVYYQPQYDAVNGRIVGAEALARIEKKDGTVIMPDEFIPLLERSDAILELDWYVLREVCSFIQKQIKDKRNVLKISVNFSRRHVAEENFVGKLCDIVKYYNVESKMIIVEITESALTDHKEKMAEIIGEIRKAGFTVAIDDFGSGLSSLSFVKDISVDILKIDKSLLTGNCEDEKERIVLESIFMFAHRLKLNTVAEGVETKEQLGFLRTCGCKTIQGFLMAKPMPSDEFEQIGNLSSAPINLDVQSVGRKSFDAMQLLSDAVFCCYPLVILSNLTQNSYYVMSNENFTSNSCPSSGMFDELISYGARSMHPEDRESFGNAFRREALMSAYENGEKSVGLVVRQLGDDGIYRKTEVTSYFVKSRSVGDVFAVSLCRNL